MTRRLIILISVLIAGQVGCVRRNGPPPVHPAEPVTGWPDTPRVSRAGRVFFAGQPGEAALRMAAAEGVDLVINLRPDQEMAKVPFDEPALVAELGMRYVSIPVTPPTFSPADVDRFDEELDTTSGLVLFHCSSSNRCGGLWAAYLVREADLAWETALPLGQAAGLARESMIEAAQQVAQSP
ncbi:MAG: protein tyrosine phosphatase family protein [Planctomycetota bacterium]|jgi:uncharacterized protein (TIGR01244 family)